MFGELIGHRNPACRRADHLIVKAQGLAQFRLKQAWIFLGTLRNEGTDELNYTTTDKVGGFVLRTESPDTRRLNDTSQLTCLAQCF